MAINTVSSERDGSIESLENVLRAEIKARMRRHDDFEKKFDNLKGAMKEAMDELRDQTSQTTADLSVKVVLKANETNQKFLSLQDKVNYTLQEIASNMGKEIDSMQSALAKLGDKGEKDKNHHDTKFETLLYTVEGIAKNNKENIHNLTSLVDKNNLEMNDKVSSLDSKLMKDITKVRENLNQTISNIKDQMYEDIKSETKALNNKIQTNDDFMKENIDFVNDRFGNVYKEIHNVKVEVDVNSVVSNMINTLDSQIMRNETAAVKREIHELSVMDIYSFVLYDLNYAIYILYIYICLCVCFIYIITYFLICGTWFNYFH
jgi:hypothetical protein